MTAENGGFFRDAPWSSDEVLSNDDSICGNADSAT
jgi:hypothetical protein